MNSEAFVDFYEILEISPNANSGTIERMFRHHARLYHPDNAETGDRDKFDLILQANNALRDPVKRAEYDVQYKKHLELRWRLAAEVRDGSGIERDAELQSNLLAFLYAKRRQNVSDAGVGNHELERLLDCTPQQLEFQIWYMKEKRWIAKNENGMVAVTVEGVDRVKSGHRDRDADKLLTDQSVSRQ